MQLKSKGRVVTVNNRRAVINEPKGLVFTVDGAQFPNGFYPQPTLNSGQLYIYSDGDNECTVNYGDGTVITYSFYDLGTGKWMVEFNDYKPSGDAQAAVPNHVYTDSNTGQRDIQITFKYPENITFINSVFLPFYKDFPKNIDILTGLQEISMRISFLTSFPNSFNLLTSLTKLTLRQVGTAISERVPTSILQNPMLTLSVNESVNMEDVYASNLYGVCEYLNSTLKNLDITSTNLLTLPPNFYKLTLLEDLKIGGENQYTTLPTQVNDVPSLKGLEIGVASGNKRDNMIYFGDLGNLVNLERIICKRSTTLQQFIPDNFENCIRFKKYDFAGSFQALSRVNRLCNEMYDFVVANASMTVGNTRFRQMEITSYSNIDPSPTPSGTYQQPPGYIQGVSNGTPSTPLEKVWVLENQYAHDWTYQ